MHKKYQVFICKLFYYLSDILLKTHAWVMLYILLIQVKSIQTYIVAGAVHSITIQ